MHMVIAVFFHYLILWSNFTLSTLFQFKFRHAICSYCGYTGISYKRQSLCENIWHLLLLHLSSLKKYAFDILLQ